MSKDKPTINDVARLSGASNATVSHVLSGKQGGTVRVGDVTRQKVLTVARELGY